MRGVIRTVPLAEWRDAVVGRTIRRVSDEDRPGLVVLDLDDGQEVGICSDWLSFGLMAPKP